MRFVSEVRIFWCKSEVYLEFHINYCGISSDFKGFRTYKYTNIRIVLLRLHEACKFLVYQLFLS